MARKPSKTKQDQDSAQQPVDPEQVETSEAETQPETTAGEHNEPETQQAAGPQAETAGSEEQEGNPASRTKARMVEATLKTRHCRGGICKEAGETMSMTQGEYDRLKKYDRVE
tara:strand:+ start:200 stop:538 length:339 start_codon:yes stop_codon:yes gene_type:complete